MSDDFGIELFKILKTIIQFDTGCIIFTNSTKPSYLFNTKTFNVNDIKTDCLKEDLRLKNVSFGKIYITGKFFSSADKKIFKTCTAIISDIIKDKEISQITKMQIKALQEGYVKIQKNSKKIKASEEEKTKFISHISHELRTPINSILGFSDILENECTGKLNTKQKEYVNDIKISALHLLEMVNEILDISKIEAGALKLNLSDFDVSICIYEVINIIKPLIIQKKLTLTQNIEKFQITADYQKFQQILLNLLSNAIKYTQEKGEINLTCERKNGQTLISIEDNGVGIEKKDFKKIFKKFEQSGNIQGNSTGLGLAITDEFVKLHKGTIILDSTKGKGSRFTVILP